MMKLIKQKEIERLIKGWVPSLRTKNYIRKIGIVEHVRKHATSVAEIYFYCKAMRLSQETFLAAKQEQVNRLNSSLGRIIERV